MHLRKHLARLVLLCFLTGCSNNVVRFSPTTVSVDEPIEIPIELPAHGLPVLELSRNTLNDEGEVVVTLAMIDTGGGATMVSPKFVKSKKLAARKTDYSLTDAQNEKREDVTVAHIKSLKIGEAKFEEFDAIVDEIKSLTSMSDRLQVVLGRPMFEELLLTIDYPKRKMKLERGALPEPNGRDVLPLKRDEHGNLLVQVRLLNEDAWMILDTGHTGDGILLSRFRLIALPWLSQPVEGGEVGTVLGKVRSRVGRMNGDAAIGQYRFEKPIVAISYDDDAEYIGADILRHFVVTIDQKNNRVQLKRPGGAARAGEPIRIPAVRRLGFQFVDKKGKIEVTPGSAAERAGLKDDDVVHAIGGVPIDRFTYRNRDAIERGDGEPVMIRFSRDGSEKIMRIPLTTLVP